MSKHFPIVDTLGQCGTAAISTWSKHRDSRIQLTGPAVFNRDVVRYRGKWRGQGSAQRATPQLGNDCVVCKKCHLKACPRFSENWGRPTENTWLDLFRMTAFPVYGYFHYLGSRKDAVVKTVWNTRMEKGGGGRRAMSPICSAIKHFFFQRNYNYIPMAII